MEGEGGEGEGGSRARSGHKQKGKGRVFFGISKTSFGFLFISFIVRFLICYNRFHHTILQ